MIVTVTGRVTDETTAVIPDVTVEALGDWLLTTKQLAKTTTDSQGRFTLKVRGVTDVADVPHSFQVRVVDNITLSPASGDHELDGTVPSHDLDLKVQRADLHGLLVTNLTGVPLYVSEGNALKMLIDGEEAFGRIAADINGATDSISMTPMFFTVPQEFHHAGRDEKPSLVFKFNPPPLVPFDPLQPSPNQPSPVPRTNDDRPERLILDRALAHTHLTVRILLNEPGLGWQGALWLAVLTPLAVGLVTWGIGRMALLMGVGIPFFPVALGLLVLAWIAEAILISRKLRNETHVDEVTAYFAAAITDAAPRQPKITVRGFRQAIPNHGVLHCKMVIVDGKRAVVIGSPFKQGYFDVPTHKIDDPRRGRHRGAIQHDVSIAVVGPAVHDLHKSLQLFWNEDLDINSTEKIGDIPVPLKETGGEDGVATVQVIRTLSGSRFKQLDKRSEKGILEAYLRAFASAKKYIYLENQYFTDSVIVEALEQVLTKKPDLELILMVNIKHDWPLYTWRQARHVKRLQTAGGARVGVFTRWTYDGNRPNNARSWITPVYIHSKVGIVDDSWATVGSANLDGWSLDYNLLLSPLVSGEMTATELNLSIIPPAAGAVTPVVEHLRRRLFAEHLGLDGADGRPNPNDPRPAAGWLVLWNRLADEALQHVKAGRRLRLPGFVLKYPPTGAGSLTSPRKHLAALGVDVKKVRESLVRPIGATRAFDFSSGKWSPTPELEDIEL